MIDPKDLIEGLDAAHAFIAKQAAEIDALKDERDAARGLAANYMETLLEIQNRTTHHYQTDDDLEGNCIRDIYRLVGHG